MSESLLVVNIIEPTYSLPVENVKVEDFIYPIVHVEYNETNVTDLNIENFTVDIGTKLALINNISYNDTTAYYTLNITIPTNNEGSKQDIWVNVTYNGIWRTDIKIESVWYYSAVTTTIIPVTTSPSQGGGGGGGGGGGPGITTKPSTISNFTVDKDLIKIELKTGESDKQFIEIFNNGKIKLTINGKILSLDEILFFAENLTENIFELNSNEKKQLEINFIAKKDQLPGVYPGKIVFTGNSIERTVYVVVEVESETPLFDVKIDVLPEYRIVYPGSKVMAQLTLYNLGKVGRVDTDVEYGIKSLDGKIITSEHELMAIETQFSTVKSLNIPVDINPDSYVFYSKVTYDGVVGTGSSMFRVVEKLKLNINLLLAIVIIAIIMILIILFIYYLRKRKDKKVKKKTKKY